MKKIICITILALALTGCEQERSNIDIAIDACKNKGGIPILSWWDGRLTDCQFQPTN